jgi:exonuclease SbcC
MRPIELIVEGFTSFRTRQVLDFSNLDLFAITGATGAGKTSLLDAITFALYDEVSQKPSSPKELVSQGAKQLKVEFRFVMRQTEYKAVRTWRNRGKTAVPNFILEELIGEEWERCSTQNVAEIIGMDFKTFTRVIILPQGKFDEFLKGEAGKRREILRQLAGFQIFEQMRKEASDRTSRFKAEREGLEKVLENIQAPTNEEAIAQQLELNNLEISIPQLNLEFTQSRKLLDTEERLFNQIQQHSELSTKLSRIQQDAPKIEVLETQFRNAQLANSIVGTWTLVQTNRKRVENAIAELTKANTNLESVKLELEKQQQVFEQFRINQIESQNQMALQERNLALAESLNTQQQQCEAELKRAEANTLTRSQAFEKSKKSTRQAEIELQNTTQQLQKLEIAIANSPIDSKNIHVNALRAELHDGDHCPVCNNLYSLFVFQEPFQEPFQQKDITEANLEISHLQYQKLVIEHQETAIAYRHAETKFKSTQEHLQLTQTEFQKAELERSYRQSQLQEIAQRLQEITAGKSYKALEKAILQTKSALNERLQIVESAYQNAREIFAKREESATKAQENYNLALAERSQQQTNWQIELATLNFTEAEFLDAQVSRSQIESWQKQIDNYQRQAQELTTRLQMISEAIGDQHTNEMAIAKLRQEVEQIEQKLQQANESRASIKAWLEQAEKKRQESQDLEDRKNSLLAQEQTYHTLSQDLRSDKFQEYILDSLQQELANRASVLLQQLSEDRYILQIESGDYWVSDNWNGGEKRRVKTLSGGETFAASLSMALALSERLSMGIELGSLFLDEGFGTLDSETLESVTQILESLRQQDRLIGVITHIQSLADRLPAQIHIRKSINGSELVRV